MDNRTGDSVDGSSFVTMAISKLCKMICFRMFRSVPWQYWSRVVLVSFALGTFFDASSQEEKILHYDVNIEVQSDRSISVVEFMEVQVGGDRIKRGITRRLPTQRLLNGQEVRVKYKKIEIEKDGRPEPYHVEKGQDLMLYVGRKEVLLEPGVYQYKIKYRVPNQIGIYGDYDEIYWNAIGTEVEFEIDKATCRVQLPSGARILQETAYAGTYGTKGTNYSKKIEGDAISYQTVRGLAPGEAFTIAVGFEKGVVAAPGFFSRLGSIILLILASIFLLPYYLYTWWKYGQDPPAPAVYPIWEAPDGLSAASLNYIFKERHGSKSFTASIVQLAINGYLKIEETTKKGFLSKSTSYDLLKLKDSDDSVTPEERQLMDALFRSTDRVGVTGEYDREMEAIYNGHRASLANQHSSFVNQGNNYHMLVIPALVTVVSFGLAFYFMMTSPYGTNANGIALITFLPLAIVAIILYAYLIKKPTPEKIDLRSRIKGFKMYLGLAEKHRLRLLNPPEMTPEHFESILPFAFALGVEHEWTGKFKQILEQAQYQPQWNNSPNMIYFSNHFGRDFSESISTATTQPSDGGSGSGGGGFSGGGGGGGGVGGW